jgi:hypothetical protein
MIKKLRNQPYTPKMGAKRKKKKEGDSAVDSLIMCCLKMALCGRNM